MVNFDSWTGLTGRGLKGMRALVDGWRVMREMGLPGLLSGASALLQPGGAGLLGSRLEGALELLFLPAKFFAFSLTLLGRVC